MSKRLVTIASYPPRFWSVLINPAMGTYYGDFPRVIVSDNKGSGTGWDFLVSVQDITGDGNANSVSVQSVGGNAGQNFTIIYDYSTAFSPATTVTSIRTVECTFTSGHIEQFEIPLTIKPHYDGLNSPWFEFDMAVLASSPGSSSLSNFQQGYYSTANQAAIDPATGVPLHNFYSLTNQNFGTAGSTTDPGLLVNNPYYIFSKFSGTNANTLGLNTNPSFTASEQFLHVKSEPDSILSSCFVQLVVAWQGHVDRLAHIYGVNSLTTPNAFNSGRQEFHQIDFLLQENNPLWYDNLETHNGVLMNVPNIINQMNANLGFMQGTYSGDNYPIMPYGNVESSPTDPAVEIRGSYNSSEVWDSIGDNIMTWNAAYELATRDADTPNSPHYHFVYKIFYAENLTAPIPPNPLHVFNVCDISGASNYYLTTSQDCSGATIPTDNLPGGVNHNITTFVPNNTCCSFCTLEITGENNSCGTYGANDKVIEVTVTDPAWTSITTTGNPWASGSQYTYNLALSNGNSLTQTMPPTGGNTVTQINCVTNITGGTEHEVTCPSSSTIVPWMQVSGAGIPAGTYVDNILTGTAGNNVTKFTLQDAVGNTVQATAAATVTLTFAAGFRFYFGSLASNTGALAGTHYILTVTDEDGCEQILNITVDECPAPTGCTDNTAINYDASAVIDDDSCLLCDATTGQLESSAGVDSGDLFTNSTVLVTDATVNASNVPQSDGIAVVTTTLDSALQSYVSLGSTETYTMTLYPVTIIGDPTTIGAVVSTQAGIASTTFNYTPQHTFTGLAYGNYAVKVQFVDSNHVLEVEECFTWIYFVVKVPVCDDILSPDYNTSVPFEFRIPDNSLCSLTPASCDNGCHNSNMSNGIEMFTAPGTLVYASGSGTPVAGASGGQVASCVNPLLMTSFQCNLCIMCDQTTIPPAPFPPACCANGSSSPPQPLYQVGGYDGWVWLHNGVPIVDQGTWEADPVTAVVVNGMSANHPSGYGTGVTVGPRVNPSGGWGGNPRLTDSTGWLNPVLIYGAGLYTLEIHMTMADGSICVYTESYNYTGLPNDGCNDPSAQNYNPSAVCPGPCIYESYECDPDPLVGCYDPGDGTGQYPTLTDCQNNCIPPDVDGCTDPCAINYDAAATTDDGSCEYKACLDVNASNYQFSCDCGIDIPTATINDQACCILPCADPPETIITTTNASGTCTPGGSNLDGSVTFTQTNINGATGYDFQIVTSPSNVIYEHPVPPFILSGASVTYSLLSAGVYRIITVDTLGCEHIEVFAIGLDVPGAGCTDPLASNYDPTATCDDGSCIYEGCTDPNASNYNPNAIIDDGSCIYTDEKNRCIPEKLKKAIVTLKACLAQKGTNWLSEYKIGTNVDCSTMNKWKLILLGHVLKAAQSEEGFGLGCLFNCADKGTPDISTIVDSCSDLWIQGAALTGLNDAATNGASVTGTSWTSGEGTTITDPALYFTTAHKLSLGDVIKMPSGLIWKVINITTNQIGPLTFSLNGLNPETATGIASGNWAKCSDNDFMNITTSINYYDNFLKFVNKYCKDCNIPPAWQQ